MSTASSNGRPLRKTLSSQLDRLDNTIDALADGLNKAVAEAVRDAVNEAVRSLIAQVMARPELMRLLTGGMNPTPAPVAERVEARPNVFVRAIRWFGTRVSRFWRGLVGLARCGWASASGKVCKVPSRFRERLNSVGAGLRVACAKVGVVGQGVWLMRKPVLVSLVIGVLVGVIGYLAGPVLSSMALGLCGSAMSFLGMLAAPFVQMWRAWRTQEAG